MTSTFAKAAVAATMALTILGTSITSANAGRRERNIAIGVLAGIATTAAIVSNTRRRADRDCWTEYQEVYSRRHGGYIERRVVVCED